jgi:hypothetical protein
MTTQKMKLIAGILIVGMISGLSGFLLCQWTGRKVPVVDPDRGHTQQPDDSGNFTLSVWNQSFEIPNADILVELQPVGDDGSVDQRQLIKLFREPMPVENQHNVTVRTFRIAPGNYSLHAHELETGTVGSWSVDIPTSGSRGRLLMFWKSATNATSRAPFFTLKNVDKGLAFF